MEEIKEEVVETTEEEKAKLDELLGVNGEKIVLDELEKQEMPVEIPNNAVVETPVLTETDAVVETVETKEITNDDEIEEIMSTPLPENYRECTCGLLVVLPNDSEEFTVCECGIKHTR